MTDAINCPSCGAANQLPESKTSMFCSFCGNSIEKKFFETKINSQKSKLKKSKIIDKKLAFKDRNIESIDEIINLYSDTELAEIDSLDLSNNRIKSLKGLSKLICREVNFSLNDLIVIDDFPSIYGEHYMIIFDFTNNKNLTGISDNAILKINSYQNTTSLFFINIGGAKNFDFENVSKINFRKILSTTYGQSSFQFNEVDSKIEIPATLKDVGFKKILTDGSSTVNWSLSLTNKAEKDALNNAVNKANSPSFGKCFIATATMGSYDHPEVMELRNFRDNWILKKRWGKSFVEWYYHYGAIAAKSIEKRFLLKAICYLLIVKPLVYLSRIVKFK